MARHKNRKGGKYTSKAIVTMTKETYAWVARLSHVQDKAIGTIIRDILEEKSGTVSK